MVTIRELPPDAWQKLIDDGVEPYATLGEVPGGSGDNWHVFVAEDEDGRIVASTSLHTQVHWDPWWIAEAQRDNPLVVRGLIRESRALLLANQVPHVFATIDDAHLATQLVAERLGFVKATGQLYLLDVADLKEF